MKNLNLKILTEQSLRFETVLEERSKFGIKGFEPLNNRIKNECLSTWLYSNKNIIIIF